MPRLGEAETEVPVLGERGGRLSWLHPSEEAWIARREERHELRRFFPDLALVAAEYREALPEKLEVGVVRLRKQVRPEISAATQTERARKVYQRITPHLAVLAAVADQSRQAMRTLSAERMIRAWYMQQPIVEVADAWVELAVEGPERPSIAWRKGEYDDVFHVPAGAEGEPGVVIFDVDPESKEDENWWIPLRMYGEALAVLLVNNAALGPLFAQVLASLDEDRLDDFVERSHLDAFVRDWTGRLRPLDDEEQEVLRTRLGEVCLDASVVLRAGRLTAADLKEPPGFDSVRELKAWLRDGLKNHLVAYLPSVVVGHDNLIAWRKWYERRRLPLGIFVEGLGGLPTSWKGELDTRAREACNALSFSPAGLVGRFLAEHGHDYADIDERLDEISPKFAPVRAAPRSTSTLGWRAGTGRSGEGQGGPHRKLTPEDLIEEGLARGAVGDAAELALLAWVVAQAEAAREEKGFPQALLSAFKKGTKTWRAVKKDLEEGDLTRALHVAARWSGAGFDVLGVEQTENGLRPVRFECKAISSGSGRVRVYLSRNELAVARSVRRAGPGRWVLVGVQPNGASVDLTTLLDDLLAEDEKPLEPLYQRGLEPDGLRLIVERPAVSSVPDRQNERP